MRKLLSLILLCTTGCAVGPHYEPPQPVVKSAGGYTTAALGIDGAADLPDHWWRLYDDPVLDGLIARALAANTDLRVANANLAKADAVLGEARAGRLPATELSGGTSYGDAAGGIAQPAGGRQWTHSGGLALSWEVDLSGRVGRVIGAARADAEAVEAVRDAVRVTVAAETARAYGDACAFGASTAIAVTSLETAEESLRIVTAQQKAGSVGRLEVERAAGDVATARAAIPEVEGRRRVALLELAALLGGQPGDVPAAAQSCTRIPAPVAALPVGEGNALLRRRPDLREAERRLAADTARIGVATADLYPQIRLGAGGNFLRNDDVKGSDSFSFSLGPLLSWSFPNMAVARSRVRQAEAQGDASLATFDGKVIGALKEVEQALARYDAGQRRNAALTEARDRAQTAYDLAQARYRAGSVSLLDTVIAQQSLIEARATLAASEQQLGSTRIDLFKALGGGWS
ncbi:NodT family efflux transporter outer membrane factor (OMF) lipoprotein [Sphingopyxis panaciterrae]|uniref:efflux transporter outer membrane subunit n=1 Tax=Sphingopyxis panaciterrae TaxID=363841 RepID=UPI00141F8AA3|nr:TolC family protein [Sphingopyxis panaciterrae]NIJ35656.1 NodT family efflux transporter outer membrane factor (OMF) lipoprotein [Sphingopyxis panaciterrae]